MPDTPKPDDTRTWTHGCDNCDAVEPVEYVAPLGYLCEECRKPETLAKLEKEFGCG